jgi:hypothetical protein
MRKSRDEGWAVSLKLVEVERAIGSRWDSETGRLIGKTGGIGYEGVLKRILGFG